MHYPLLTIPTADGPVYIRGDHITRCKPCGNGFVTLYTLDGKMADYPALDAAQVLDWLEAQAAHAAQVLYTEDRG